MSTNGIIGLPFRSYCRCRIWNESFFATDAYVGRSVFHPRMESYGAFDLLQKSVPVFYVFAIIRGFFRRIEEPYLWAFHMREIKLWSVKFFKVSYWHFSNRFMQASLRRYCRIRIFQIGNPAWVTYRLLRYVSRTLASISDIDTSYAFSYKRTKTRIWIRDRSESWRS